jgi:uncharacterized protein YeaO (DUF488 family)
VNKLLPRGISKEKVDLWLKEIDPINDQREWFGNYPMERVQERYFIELNDKIEPVEINVREEEKEM